jgi:hypothetical protein
MTEERQISLRWIDLAVPVVAAVIVLVLAELLHELGLPLTLQSSAYVAVIAATSAILSVVLTAFVVRKLMNPVINGAADQVSTAINGTANQMSSAIELLRAQLASSSLGHPLNDEYIAEFERTISSNHIWVISPDLHKDVPFLDGVRTFEDIVRNNVTLRRVQYTYIVPERNMEIGPRLERLLARYDPPARELISYHVLPEDDWNRLPYVDGDITVYNPHLERSGQAEVYYELPHRTKGLWMRVDDEIAIKWLGRIQKVVPHVITSSPGSQQPTVAYPANDHSAETKVSGNGNLQVNREA